MTVYRIQSRQDRTRGAYTCKLFLCTNGRGLQPHPYEDIGIERNPESNEFCGFLSAVDLLRWFGSSIVKILREYECEIVALRNVTITAVGEYQVLFKWND